MSSLSSEGKERILKAIEEDRAFRYALMGLLGFREVLDRLSRIEERQQRLEEELIRVRRLAEYNRRDMGALTEAVYSRWVYEDLREELRSRGVEIMGYTRNYILDNVEVDLLIEAKDKICVVEVEIQPNHHDVDELIGKARFIGGRIGEKRVPVLATIRVCSETYRYCIGKGVYVLKY